MAAIVGRKVTFAPATTGVTVIGARSKSLTVNNEAIDITSDDDSGFRTLLAGDAAMQSLDFSIEGILKDDELLTALSSGSVTLESYEVEFTGIGTFAGNFHFQSVALGAPYNEAVTFSATVVSSGEFTFTAAS
jgi:predicted secreted protein